MVTTSSLRALLVEKLSLPEAATCAAVFSSVAKCFCLRPDLSLFPPLVSVPAAHQLALCAPSAFPHAHFALAQLPRSLGSLSSKSETSDMYSSSRKSSFLCRWSSRCITWRSHEPGASNSTPACGLPVAPIDGYWWVLGIGVLNPVGIGYCSFGLGGYWVLEL